MELILILLDNYVNTISGLLSSRLATTTKSPKTRLPYKLFIQSKHLLGAVRSDFTILSK